MEIVNTTPVVARCVVQELQPGHRVAMLTAKATFLLHPRPQLSADQALPLFEEDRTTEGGVLPGDAIGRYDEGFEVLSVGDAHVTGCEPMRAMTVSLTVGDVRRSLLVVGDRTVRPDGSITRPEPFWRMPLGWGHAFGGRRDVTLEPGVQLPIAHHLNGWGRGFDPLPAARRIARRLRAPTDGVVIEPRRLPNVENPRRPIRSAADDPEPYGWSAIPRTIGLSMEARRRIDRERPGCDAAAYRAHPDWVMDLPDGGARVQGQGLCPQGSLGFDLPRLRVFADARGARVELCPQTLVLAWHRGLFTVTYRRAVSLAHTRPRCVRLRLAEGWWTDHRKQRVA